MNEIEAWIENPIDIQEGVNLFCKYSTHNGLKSTFQSNQIKLQRVQAKLIYELRKLKNRPDIAPYAKPMPKGPVYRKEKAIKLPGNEGKTPEEISEAIRKRTYHINQREKAGRLLTEEADNISQEERAKLIAHQKKHHGHVVILTGIVQRYKLDGVVMAIPGKKVAPPPDPSLSEEDIAELKRLYKNLTVRKTRTNKSLKKAREEKKKAKIKYYQEVLKEIEKELDEIRTKTGMIKYGEN